MDRRRSRPGSPKPHPCYPRLIPPTAGRLPLALALMVARAGLLVAAADLRDKAASPGDTGQSEGTPTTHMSLRNIATAMTPARTNPKNIPIQSYAGLSPMPEVQPAPQPTRHWINWAAFDNLSSAGKKAAVSMAGLGFVGVVLGLARGRVQLRQVSGGRRALEHRVERSRARRRSKRALAVRHRPLCSPTMRRPLSTRRSCKCGSPTSTRTSRASA